MTRTAKLLGSPDGQRWLTVGLCLIAFVQIVQGTINGAVVLRVEKRALKTYRDSLSSVEYLTVIDRDMGTERVLVDDHIFEHEPASMRTIEMELAALDRDIEQTGARYEREIDQPNESQLWRRVQLLWAQFEVGKSLALAHSRKHENAPARAAMIDVRDEYRELQQTLVELHLINQKGSLNALSEVARLQRWSQQVSWVLRVVALVTVVLLGLWGRQRIASYEKRILEDARILEERNHDLDSFAGRVAHDLKNALSPMALIPDMLRRSQRDPPRVLEIADRAERSFRRSFGILDALLAFSRTSGSVDKTAAFEPVLRSVLEELAPQIAAIDVTIEVDVEPGVLLHCDAGLLHIVLTNLCGNAIKFLEGRQRRLVRVSGHAEDGSFRIEVGDTGPGIPEEARTRIFEPFYRVAGTRAPGSGIGLATVRRIVETHGGHVTVDSVLGHGSCFRCWLPRVEPSPDAPQAPGDDARPMTTH